VRASILGDSKQSRRPPDALSRCGPAGRRVQYLPGWL